MSKLTDEICTICGQMVRSHDLAHRAGPGKYRHHHCIRDQAETVMTRPQGPRATNTGPEVLSLAQKITMLAILAHDRGATNTEIRDEIKARTGLANFGGGVVGIIRTLEIRNFIVIERSKRTHPNNGMGQNVSFVTEAGLEALREAVRVDDAMREGLDLDRAEVLEEGLK